MFGAFFFKLKIEFVNFINVDFEIQKKEWIISWWDGWNYFGDTPWRQRIRCEKTFTKYQDI